MKQALPPLDRIEFFYLPGVYPLSVLSLFIILRFLSDASKSHSRRPSLYAAVFLHERQPFSFSHPLLAGNESPFLFLFFCRSPPPMTPPPQQVSSSIFVFSSVRDTIFFFFFIVMQGSHTGMSRGDTGLTEGWLPYPFFSPPVLPTRPRCDSNFSLGDEQA